VNDGGAARGPRAIMRDTDTADDEPKPSHAGRDKAGSSPSCALLPALSARVVMLPPDTRTSPRRLSRPYRTAAAPSRLPCVSLRRRSLARFLTQSRRPGRVPAARAVFRATSLVELAAPARRPTLPASAQGVRR
jgi:hypothetical protein